MLSAKLHNGQIISSIEYEENSHGSRLFCIDKKCGVPLIFVSATEEIKPHFKTTGKGDSKHTGECGFFRQLDLVETISKISEYHADVQQNGMNEILIRLSMNGIDPDRESSTVEREKEKKNTDILKVKNETLTPQSISSVKGVIKLVTENEPDILSSILINIGGGNKVSLNELILSQNEAHKKLWGDGLHKIGYFVYGKVEKVVKREKVLYINFEETTLPFTIVIFQTHWKHFKYSEEQLIGKDVLVYGHLRKNDYQEKELTEMIIKSDRYLGFFNRKNK